MYPVNMIDRSTYEEKEKALLDREYLSSRPLTRSFFTGTMCSADLSIPSISSNGTERNQPS